MEVLDLNDQLISVTRCLNGLSGLMDGYSTIPVAGSEISALIEMISEQVVRIEDRMSGISAVQR
jgi:hypothetical protein